MVRTPTKRAADRSPDDARPSKRQATSSPEEGEVATPPHDSHSYSARPPSPPKFDKPKVKFPFKRKADADVNGASHSSAKLADAKVVYERPVEEEGIFREVEQSRHRHRRASDSRSARPSHDHYEPSYSSSRDRDRDLDRRRPPRAPGAWDAGHSGSSRYYAHPYDDRAERSRRHDYDYPPTSSRTDRDRDRSYARVSRSPSVERSRSPASPAPSAQRRKHRLPENHSPNFSPPTRDYQIDRIRDDRRRDDPWERDRYHDRSDDRYARDDDRSRGHYYPPELPAYPRQAPADDRHYRPGGDPGPAPSRYHSRRDDYERRPGTHRDDRWSRREDDPAAVRRDLDRDLDNYRPRSPSPAAPPTSPRHHAHTERSPPQPPRIPISSTPPPPPPASPPPPPPTNEYDDAALPREHAAVSISIPTKRPGAPRDPHSPAPLSLPLDLDPGSSHRGPEAPPRDESAGPKQPSSQRRKREPVQRSREEELKAYGRMFEGCGKQSDYEVTTKLGEGTFGEVHKAIQRSTNRAVALKRILMHNEKEGMPVTALREIKILKALDHPCIVNILDMFVVRSKGKESSLSVYMVFPYMDHDLAGLLENERVKLQPSHIKLYMKQLLEGTEYMHRNHILHRDMKAANLLISNTGTLLIADFGLARAYDPSIVVGDGTDHRGKDRKYTNCVVTRWYRPPELLMGARQYGGEIDLWGIGCVLGEMFFRKPILPGQSDLDQLEKIWQLCGTPNQHSWPNYDALPGCEGVKRFNSHPRRIKQVYESIGPETCDLLEKLLTCNPRERITASQALDHDYFWTDPLPADPKILPTYEASHEFDKRGRRPPMPPPGPVPPPDAQYRQPPMAQPPMYFGRGPPPREAFRTGPPSSVPPPGLGLPPPSFSNGPPGYPPGPHYPPRGYGGPPPPSMPYRQGPPGDRWEPSGRAPNLPPRPLGIPPPRGGGYGGRDQRGPRGGGTSNAGELPYG